MSGNGATIGVDLTRQRHDEALYRFGEYAVFILLWRVEDYEAGLVERCSTCYSEVETVVAEVYQQPTRKRCPDCFGTTFEGGYKARIIRPSIWEPEAEVTQEHSRGEVITNSAQMETSWDFRLRSGDYAFRKDGGRWRMTSPRVALLHDGFEPMSPSGSAVGYTYQMRLLDPSSVAYDIPPAAPELGEMLDVHDRHFLPDLAEHEDVRGPLL